MTIKLTVTTGVAKAQITSMSLPSSLEAGKAITGSIVLTNIGTAAGRLRVIIITEWNGNFVATSPSAIGVNSTFATTITAGLMTMPSKDAIITINGLHETSPGSENWVIDDTKTH